MKVVLCSEGSCVPQKCPVVDVQEDKVIIGEKEISAKNEDLIKLFDHYNNLNL